MIYQIKIMDGNVYWHVNDKCHRLDGPAIELANGDREWWIDGNPHRLDGPAIEWDNDYQEWWIDGKKLTEYEFKIIVNTREDS